MRVTLAQLQRMKREGRKIAMLTAYDTPSALIAERAGVPTLLVGDSLGMVVLGHSTTLPVTLDDMVRHAQAVMRGSSSAFVVADLPFLTYASPGDAVASAKRLMQEAGVHAVKLEGGAAILPQVRLLVQSGVPVMGHLGFTPQSEHQIGVRVQARQTEGARQLLQDALALQAAGAWGIVLELVPAPLARAVSTRLAIPTIGIGAGAGCDGQVQVWHDILGLFDDKPRKHTKVFAAVGAMMQTAIAAYVAEVAGASFPTEAQSAGMDEDELARALQA